MTNLIVNNMQESSDCKSSEKIERIPRIIHYCWMSNDPFPPLVQKCIDSWKKFCPDYQIIKWDSSNVDLDYCPFIREAYDAKRWAFVSDVVRLYSIVNYGGFYLDSDVEILKPLDDLLKLPAVTGFECGSEYALAMNSMACEKGHPAFVEFLKAYEKIHFRRIDGTFNQTPIPQRITKICLKYGLVCDNSEQTLSNGLHILPQNYLSPKNWLNGAINITPNTYMIHHFTGEWLKTDERDYYDKMYNKISSVLHISGFIPKKIASVMTLFKFYGIFAVFCHICRFIGRKLGIPQK